MSNDYDSAEYWMERLDGKEVLNLDSNNIGDEGAEALADALGTNTSLKRLYLVYNNIGESGAKALADALRTNKSLQWLDLYNNNIGNEGAKALADALRTNTSLQWLSLNNNNIGESGVSDEICEKTRRNRRFHALKESKYIEKRSVLQTFLKTHLLQDFTNEMMIWRGEECGGGKIKDYEIWKEWKHQM